MAVVSPELVGCVAGVDEELWRLSHSTVCVKGFVWISLSKSDKSDLVGNPTLGYAEEAAQDPDAEACT